MGIMSRRRAQARMAAEKTVIGNTIELPKENTPGDQPPPAQEPEAPAPQAEEAQPQEPRKHLSKKQRFEAAQKDSSED